MKLKKILFLLSFVCFASTASVTSASAQVKIASQGGAWIKSTTQMWVGKDNLWYRLDKADMAIQNSRNGTQWTAVENGQWNDKDGKYYKIESKKLMVSDNAKAWTEAAKKLWVGEEGKMYKFDTNWDLMVIK
jgi:hypothetical protein